MKTTGRKIWYGIAIFLCGLIILLSVAGIGVTWITKNALSVSISNLVDNLTIVTENIRTTMQRFDQKLASMQEVTNSISQASTTLSQKVGDQGLISTLLPEEQTTKLGDLSASVQDSIQNIRDTLATVRAVYQTVDQLPFIKLPGLSQDQIDKFQQSITTVQSTVDEVKNAIAAFRAGASEQISKITSVVNQLGSNLGDARSRLADLDTRIVDAQNRLAQLKQTISRALLLVSILVSLFLIFIVYTQVEMIRLYVQRWQNLGSTAGLKQPAEQPALQDPDSTSDVGKGS